MLMAGGGGYDAQIILGRLGNPWTLVDLGIAIKPFPSGALTHPAMGKLKELVIEHDIRPEQVTRVRIRTNRLLTDNLTYHRPETGLQGKFSMEFCLASILVLRKAGLSEFTDETVNRADIRNAVAKIDYSTYSDEEALANDYKRLTSFIDIEFEDGRKISARADIAKGDPLNPMSADEVAGKFRECAAFARWPRDRSDKIIQAVSHLEKVARISELAALLKAGNAKRNGLT